MVSLRPPDGDDRTAFVAVLFANLLPLPGLVWLEWEPTVLVFVYGLEVLLSLLLASVKALFAQRRPPSDRESGVLTLSDSRLAEKRGSVQPVAWLPPIFLRNVPFALAVLYVTPLYGLFFGLFLLEIADVGPELLGTEVLASVGALFVGQLVELDGQYRRRRQYERVSPYAAVETAARQVFVLIFVVGTLGVALGSTGALVFVVGLKLLVELAAHRTNRADDDSSRFIAWFAGPSEPDDSEASVRVPSAAPTGRVRPDRSAVVRNALFRAATRAVGYLPIAGLVGAFVVLSLASLLESSPVVPLGVVALVVLIAAAVGVQVVIYFLVYGTLEYQRRGEHLVAYDWLVEEPQWSTRVEDLRDVTMANDRFTDRLLGTRTIQTTTRDDAERNRLLGPFADPGRAVDALELPLEAVALEPMDRRLAVGAATLVGVAILSIVVTTVAPGMPDAASTVAGLAAFVLVVVALGLWHQAFPDGE